MIYINKDKDFEEVVTDCSILFPTKVEVFFDKINIGEFINESEDKRYIIFTLSKIDMSILQLKNYYLILKLNGEIIKKELVSVTSDKNYVDVKVINNKNTKVKFYGEK